MRPRERRETSEQDLFRSRLDQIIDMKHALVRIGNGFSVFAGEFSAKERRHAVDVR